MPDQQQQINYGAAPNDGQGDPLRDAFIKTDDNFDAIWAAGPVGSNVTIINNTVSVVNTNGNLVLRPNGVGVIQANASIVPDSANIRDLGAANRRWRRVYLQTLNTVDYEVEGDLTVSGNLTIQGDTIQIGNLVTDAKTLQLSNTAANAAQATGSGITVGVNDDIATLLYDSANDSWNTNIGFVSSGNVSAAYFIGDGSALSGLPVPYTDTDVVNLLSSGNVVTDITTSANVSAAYILGNGSQLTGLPEQYGNANVANLLADFGSNNIVTTGNISGGQLEIAPGGGNAWTISGQSISAPSGGEWRSEDDSLDDFITSAPNGYINMQSLYADGNIASELKLEHGVARLVIADAPFAEWTFNTTGQLDVPGDIVPDANGVYNLGSESLQWANLWIANNTIYLGGVPLGISSGNVLTVDGNAVLQNNSNTAISTTGNITADYFIGNGSQLTAVTGNVTFSDQIVIGTGISNVVGGLYLSPSPSSANALQYLRVRGDVSYEPTHIHFDTGNNLYFNQFIGDDNKYVLLANTGNIVINTSDYAENTAQWTFGTDGTLTFPDSTLTIGNTLGSPAIVSAPGTPLQLISSGNNIGAIMAWIDDLSAPTQQAVIVTNNPLYVGEGDVGIVTGNTLNVEGGTGYIWNFDNTGNLALPRGGIVYETNIPGGVLAGNTISLAPSGGIDADQQLLIYPTAAPVTDDNHLHLTTGNLYNTELYLGNDDLYVKLANTGNVVVNSNDAVGNTAQWTFGIDGVLTLPNGAVIRDTAGNAVAIGLNAGLTNQSNSAVAIGPGAGEISQGFNAVAVGSGAGANAQGSGAVSVGVGAGFITQGDSTVAIGASAGYQAQAVYAVAIGLQAGQTSQAQDAIAIGRDAGFANQGEIAVAIGHLAGNASQGNAAVAVGASAGTNTQGVHAVAIGTDTGATTQGNRAVAIGYLAGSIAQGTESVAIGYYAGETNQGNNSIIINATGTALQQTTANTFTVAPVRNDVANIAEVVFYNTTSKEITYGNVISVAGNITAGNISTGQGLVQSLDITADGIINAGALNVNSSAVPGATGNITGGNLSVTGNVTGNIAGFAIGYRDIPQVSFTGNATIATGDAGKHFYSTQSSNYILTIANNASQGFQTGAAITIVNQGTGNITVAQASGVTLYLAGNATSGNRTVATYGMATIMKVATDTWFINGTGVS